MPLPEDAETTQTGDEFYPEALEATIRYAAQETGKPVYVTENGIATQMTVAAWPTSIVRWSACNDALQMASTYAVTSTGPLLDNFEWIFGYGPKFGLVAVDRGTQRRTPKPSARHLGGIARAMSR